VYLFGGFTLLLAFGRTICSVVTCEGGIITLSCNPLPSQNPRSLGTSPLGLTTLNRKNHPIVVTLGGIGSCYASLTLQSIAFYPCYKRCDNNDNNNQHIIPIEEYAKPFKEELKSTKFKSFCLAPMQLHQKGFKEDSI
jgi:hypothetical protein